jgi:PIN domain nuclease of toxin-antitoxin system
MRVISRDNEIAILSRALQFVHDDPADRFIASTAYSAQVPLATVDSRLASLPWLRTVS